MILGNEQLEIIRKGSEYSGRKGEIGRNVTIQVLVEKLGFPKETILLKRVNEGGVDIPATDSRGNRVAVQVKLTTTHRLMKDLFDEAIAQLQTDLSTGEYTYGLVFVIYADRHTGRMTIEWIRLNPPKTKS